MSSMYEVEEEGRLLKEEAEDRRIEDLLERLSVHDDLSADRIHQMWCDEEMTTKDFIDLLETLLAPYEEI